MLTMAEVLPSLFGGPTMGSEWLRDICENTVSKMQNVLDRVERAELGGRV